MQLFARTWIWVDYNNYFVVEKEKLITIIFKNYAGSYFLNIVELKHVKIN